MSEEPYPFKHVWPFLHQIIDAFRPERLMWGSDFTRMRWVPVEGGLAPRDQWKLYSDCLNYLRDTSEVSEADMVQLLSGTIRRVLRWPKTP